MLEYFLSAAADPHVAENLQNALPSQHAWLANVSGLAFSRGAPAGLSHRAPAVWLQQLQERSKQLLVTVCACIGVLKEDLC